ncbi:MAG: hypothetical protein RIG61_00210 [Deltaproteobacteria bacterium]
MIVCPECGSEDVVPIVYGLPTPDTFESAGRGEIRLGGCEIEEDSPTLICKSCGREWQDKPFDDF